MADNPKATEPAVKDWIDWFENRPRVSEDFMVDRNPGQAHERPALALFDQARKVAESTVFKTNRTQAVRIPKDLAFPDSVRDVVVSRVGDTLTITPKYASWKDWAENTPALPDDFPDDIEDLPQEEREPF